MLEPELAVALVVAVARGLQVVRAEVLVLELAVLVVGLVLRLVLAAESVFPLAWACCLVLR